MLKNLIIREKPLRTTQNFKNEHRNTTLKALIVALGEGIEISHYKLPPMPQNSAFMFHHPARVGNL